MNYDIAQVKTLHLFFYTNLLVPFFIPTTTNQLYLERLKTHFHDVDKCISICF